MLPVCSFSCQECKHCVWQYLQQLLWAGQVKVRHSSLMEKVHWLAHLGSRPSSGHNNSSYFILFLATVPIKVMRLRNFLKVTQLGKVAAGFACTTGSPHSALFFAWVLGATSLQSLCLCRHQAPTSLALISLPLTPRPPDPSSPVSLPPEAPPLPLGQRHVPSHPPAPAHCLFPAVRMRRRRSALRSVSARGCGGAGGSSLSGSSLGGGGRGSVDASSAS